MTPAWAPLLEGDEAAAARAAATDVSRALAASGWSDAGLYHGQAGIALLHGALARAGDDEAEDAAAEALGAVVASLDEERRPWLAGGVAGAAFAIAQLRDVIEVDDDTIDGFDEMLLGVVAPDAWPHAWELMQGLIGIGVYGLERAATGAPAGRALVGRVVQLLAARAERDAAGARLASAPGSFSLGFAYGNLGLLALLAGARACGADGAAPWLLDEGIAWLRPLDRPGAPHRFPQELKDGVPVEEPSERPTGWCYGDPGAALVLVMAGRACAQPAWVEHGLAVARHAAAGEARVVAEPDDLSLCHGQVGRGHIYARLAQATGAGDLADAARACYRRALAARTPGAGLGGFTRISRQPTTTDPMFASGLQLGAAGVGLGLLAAASEEPPAWDRALLLSAPLAQQ